MDFYALEAIQMEYAGYLKLMGSSKLPQIYT
jgi:hypothetical protein